MRWRDRDPREESLSPLSQQDQSVQTCSWLPGAVHRCVGELSRELRFCSPPVHSGEGSDSPGAGTQGNGPNPDASFSLAVRAWSSLRCQVCGTGHSLAIFQRSCSPSPRRPAHKAISQSLPFHNSSKADASILPRAENVRRMSRAQHRCQVDSSLLAFANARAWLLEMHVPPVLTWILSLAVRFTQDLIEPQDMGEAR